MIDASWLMKTDEGDATALRPLGDSTLVNAHVARTFGFNDECPAT